MHQNDATCSKVVVYSQSPLKNGQSRGDYLLDRGSKNNDNKLYVRRFSCYFIGGEVVRLIVKKDGKRVDELGFESGPVKIGRRSSNDVALRDPKVSKQHAVISCDSAGNWTIEDLDSANKTYLNDRAIHKAKIKTGDKIGISVFTIEVDLEAAKAVEEAVDINPQADEPELDDIDIGQGNVDVVDISELDEEIDISDIDLSGIGRADATSSATESSEAVETSADEVTIDDKPAEQNTTAPRQPAETDADKSQLSGTKISSAETGLLMVAPREPQIIIRKIGAEKSPPIRFDSERIVEFLQVIDAINKAGSIDKVLLVLLEAVAKQFGACYIWSALRNQPGGPMTTHAGRQRDGRPIDFQHIPLNDKINDAIEKGQFLLLIFSRDMDLEKGRQVRSALIAPILDSTGCYGAIYANNTFRDEHYDLGDLDYLMLIAIHAATVLQKL